MFNVAGTQGVLCVVLAQLLWLGSVRGDEGYDFKGKKNAFAFNKVERLINGQLLDSSGYYEPSVTTVGHSVRIAMLEFEPGAGDRIVTGTLASDGTLTNRRVLTRAAGQYRNPIISVDGKGIQWLTFESLQQDVWSVFVRKELAGGGFADATRISGRGVSAINHDVAALTDGGIAAVWQEDQGGQWDVRFAQTNQSPELANRTSLSPSTDARSTHTASTLATERERGQGMTNLSATNQRGDWRPVIAAGPDGRLCVAWDAYDGESFSVRLVRFDGDQWGEPFFAAHSRAFEGRADLTFDAAGRLFVLWEEGGWNWGKEYRDFESETNTQGPLHRFRYIHVAEIRDNNQVVALGLPLPSVREARSREDVIADRNELGLYYERGRFALDGSGQLWVFYRHYFYPQLGVTRQPVHHIEAGWRLYGRCFQDGKWSGLIGLEPNQRDGMQHLSLTPTEHGLAAVWTTGRTHRGQASGPQGVAVAFLDDECKDALAPFEHVSDLAATDHPVSMGNGRRDKKFAPQSIDGRDYEVYFGDLHRHTDLSLCRVYFDGTLDDAYRYAIEAAELDFLGVTDHARDISNGDVGSQLWWRSIKEVTRHRLEDTFFPMFAYERSHGETDHNVISLRSDMLRPYNPSLKTFWNEIDDDTFTIPHNPIRPLKAFAFHDDEKRPLLEIYQACRDNAMHGEAHIGLDQGYHMGFIASSDHMATRTAFACVWSPRRNHETIFRSLQARRTYAATAKIRLVFRTGDHWMGEIVTALEMPEFSFDIEAAAPIDRVAVVQDGRVVKTLTPNRKDAIEFSATFRPEGDVRESPYVYIHVLQQNDDQAWSSPIWLETP